MAKGNKLIRKSISLRDKKTKTGQILEGLRGKIRGQTRITNQTVRKLVTDNPNLSVSQLMKKLGNAPVSANRRDFKDTMKQGQQLIFRGDGIIKSARNSMNYAKSLPRGAERRRRIENAKIVRKQGLVLKKIGTIKLNKGIRMMYGYPTTQEKIIKYYRSNKFGRQSFVKKIVKPDPFVKAYRTVRRKVRSEARTFLKSVSDADKREIMSKLPVVSRRDSSTSSTKKYLQRLVETEGITSQKKLFNRYMTSAHTIHNDPTGVKSMRKGRNFARMASNRLETARKRLELSKQPGTSAARRRELEQMAKKDKLYSGIYKKIGAKLVESGFKIRYGKFTTRNEVTRMSHELLKEQQLQKRLGKKPLKPVWDGERGVWTDNRGKTLTQDEVLDLMKEQSM